MYLFLLHFLAFAQIVFSVFLLVYLNGRFRPLAYVNFFFSFFVLPGSLYYSKFYPYFDETGQKLQIVLIIFLIFLSLWLTLTYKINSFHKKKLFEYNFLDKDFFYIWIILTCFIILSGVLLIYELGGVQNTGFWGLFFEQDRNKYNLLRDASFKSLESGYVRDLYSMSKLLTPYVFISSLMIFNNSKFKVISIVAMILVIFIMMLQGSRGSLIQFFLYYILFIFFHSKKIQLVKILSIIISAFFILIIISTLRSTALDSLEVLEDKMFQVIRRVFITPFFTGVLHLKFIEIHGLWDYIKVTAIPFKNHIGIEHINHFRIVGEWDTKDSRSHYNTSELFLQISIFGVYLGAFISFIKIITLDLLSLLSHKVNKTLRLPLFVSIIASLINLVSSGLEPIIYQTIFVVLILYMVVISRKLLLISSTKTLM